MSCKCVDPKSLSDLCAFCQNEYLAYVHCTDYTPQEPGLKEYISNAEDAKEVTFTVESGAVKHDSGKPPLSMVSGVLMRNVAAVRAFGAKKYNRDNWRKGFAYTRSLDSALRHIFDFKEGQDFDKESGLCNIAHAVCCLEHLLNDIENHPENDDRYKK